MAATDWFSDFAGELPTTESTPIHDRVIADLATATEPEDTGVEVNQ